MLDLIKDKYKTISIIGMAKNSGKTVALNYLIEEAIDEGLTIGLTSIGRDGESIDIVSETEKPQIFVDQGTLIATASGVLGLGDANIEILEVTDYPSPLGDIVIGRVKDGGYVQIAGPQRLSQIKAVGDTMLRLGASFVIIDGALDRISQAAPAISEAAILSTGAVLSRDMNKVIEKTLHRVKTLDLKKIQDEEIRNLAREAIDNKDVAIINDKNQVQVLPVKTALNSGQIMGSHIREDSRYLVIPGSLVKTCLDDLVATSRRYKDIEIIITDGTKVFVEAKDWLHFMKLGLRIGVLDEINLIGITLNPYSPAGYYFEPKTFIEKMKTYIKDLPVMDLVYGPNGGG